MFDKETLKRIRDISAELLGIAEEIKSAKAYSARMEYLVTQRAILSDELKKVFDQY